MNTGMRIFQKFAYGTKNLFLFYYEGFRNMTIGRTLWIIILAKLFVMFAILKLFFFPNILERDYDTDEQRAHAVFENLTKDTGSE